MAATPSSTSGSGGGGRRVVLVLLAVLAVTAAVAAFGFLGVRELRAPLPMSVRPLMVESAALGRAMPVQAWVPPGTPDDARLPVVVLLHGAGGDEATWFGGSLGDGGLRADAVAAALIEAGRIPPVVLVAPAIDDSYGVDSVPADDRWDHGFYGTYLRDELMPALPGLLPVSDAARDMFVGGLSMGGFAALHVALRDPASFAGVAALSPALWVDVPTDRAWIQAPAGDRAGHDPLELVRSAPIDDLGVFLGRGDRDDGWIVDGTDTLAARLAERGRAAAPMIVPGGHEAATWRALTAPMLESLLGT